MTRIEATCSCELFQKTQIVLREKTDVGNVEQNHGQPVHSETESEPGPFFRIVGVVAARIVYLLENGRDAPCRSRRLRSIARRP